ncbi:hypothetical protein [Maribacter dokdonensis]|uniref:hypothetical protein n=1 Tax=Maribacter dokdonensis TaxID=320912 RepID=UPI0007198B8C|nr:hypothetical protein [Maribacter dokdonensis]KSA11565.1 hypothetical protein I600_3854 [Maribacter dokdonensis DSW-8]
MQEFRNWKEFINQVLIDSGQFENSTSELINQTEIETFKSTDKNSLTKIRVGYLETNSLIYLQIFNPTIPGYNKYVEGEYFYQHHFSDDGKTYGNPALEFNERNRNGILSILKNGLKGKEVQFVKNSKILKSKLYIAEFDSNFSYSYDFTKRGFLHKIFGQKIDKMDGIEKREIELNTIFSGIKNVLQQRCCTPFFISD